mgnify:CR=1 FL=1
MRLFNRTTTLFAALLSGLLLLLAFLIPGLGRLPLITALFFFLFCIPAGIFLKDTADRILAAALASLGFFFWFATYNPYLVKEVVFSVFLLALFASYLTKKKELRFSLFDIVIVSGVFLTCLFSLNGHLSDRFAEFVIHFQGFVCIYFFAKNIRDKERFAGFLMYSGVILALWGLMQWAGLDPLMPARKYSEPFSQRIVGTLGNPNFYSGYMLGIMGLTFYTYMTKRSPLLLAAFLIEFLSIIGSGTRGVLLAFALTAFLFILYRKKYALLAFLAAMAVTALVIPSTSKRLLNIPRQLKEQSGSVGQRSLMWKTALSIVKEKPLGLGYAGFRMFYPEYQARFLNDEHLVNLSTHARHPHNQALEWAINGSVPGFLWYIFIFLCAVFLARREKPEPLKEAFLFMFILMYADNLISVVLNYEPALSLFAVSLGIFTSGIRSSFRVPRKVLALFAAFIALILFIRVQNLKGSFHLSRGAGLYQLNAKDMNEDAIMRSIGELEMSLKWDSRSVHAHYQLGNDFLMLAQKKTPDNRSGELIETGISHLKAADALKPAYYEIRYNIGVGYTKLGQLGLAEEYLKSALEIEPFNLPALIQLTEVTSALKDILDPPFGELLSRVEKSVELLESSLIYIEGERKEKLAAEILKARLYTQKQRAFLRYKSGDLHGSLTGFQSALETAEQMGNIGEKKLILNNLISVCARMGSRFEIEYINEFLKIVPNSAELYFKKAVFLAKNSAHAEALAILKRIISGTTDPSRLNTVYADLIASSCYYEIEMLPAPLPVRKISSYIEKRGLQKEELHAKYPEWKELINEIEKRTLR